MHKSIIAASVVAVIFQIFIVIGLLLLAYSPSFGLMELATNGSTLLQQVDLIEPSIKEHTSDPIRHIELIRAVLLATNNAFARYADLLGKVASILSACALVQIAGIYCIVKQGRRADT